MYIGLHTRLCRKRVLEQMFHIEPIQIPKNTELHFRLFSYMIDIHVNFLLQKWLLVNFNRHKNIIPVFVHTPDIHDMPLKTPPGANIRLYSSKC